MSPLILYLLGVIYSQREEKHTFFNNILRFRKRNNFPYLAHETEDEGWIIRLQRACIRCCGGIKANNCRCLSPECGSETLCCSNRQLKYSVKYSLLSAWEPRKYRIPTSTSAMR